MKASFPILKIKSRENYSLLISFEVSDTKQMKRLKKSLLSVLACNKKN